MNSVRAWYLLLIACFLTAPAGAGELRSHPYRGITYITRTEISPRPVTMHIVEVDLTAPGLSFKLTPPGGTLETVKQTTLEFLNQEHAQVAINCHFMLPFPSVDTNVSLVGLAVSQGSLYSPFEPQPIASNYVDQSYAILPYSAALNIDSSNRASIVHANRFDPTGRKIMEPVTLWNAVSGSAQIITDGLMTIPFYTGRGQTLSALNGYSDVNSWYERARARTVIGLTANNQTLVLLTVDETAGSGGMTLGEVAGVLMNDYHVHNALNLDGGGSTTLAMQDPFTGENCLANSPSDSPLGRAVGSSLAIFAPSILDRTKRLNIALTATNTIVASWPSSSKGWRLQQASEQGSTNWTYVTAFPHDAGFSLEVVLPVQDTAMFYRLSK